MPRSRNIALTVALFFCLPAASGCVAVAVGAGAAGTVAYVRGDLESVVDATPKRVIDASSKAMQQMGIAVLSSGASDLDGQLTARTAQDRRVTIKVKRATETTSHLSIRIGTFGDQAMSQAIYDKIRANL